MQSPNRARRAAAMLKAAVVFSFVEFAVFRFVLNFGESWGEPEWGRPLAPIALPLAPLITWA